MPHPKVKISDNSGNEVGVTSNALDVNIAGGATIDIGDVDMFLDGGTAIVGGAGHVEPGVLRVTLADNDAHWGSVGAAADNDGVAHAQLHSCANYLENVSGMLGYTIKATGGQYAEGTGSLVPIVRNDTLASLVTDDNDFAPLQVNSSGALYVTGGGGGTEYTEDVATANPIVGTATLIERDDALSSVTPAEGDWIGLRGTAEGALWTQDFNSDTITTHLSEIEGAVETIEGAVSGSEMQVDVVAALPAGSNAIGKLAANSGVDIGDVDITSIAAGDNNIGNVDIASSVTLSVNSHAVTNAGTFATQVDGDALTALQLLDDVVHVDDAGFTLGSHKGIMMMGFAGSQSVDSNDAAALRCTSGGQLMVSLASTSATVVTSSEVTLGTNTYSETNTTGSVVGVVRNDTLATLADTDNEFAPLQVNADGALYVDIADGGQLDALLDTIKVDTEAIETAVELLDNAISGSEMQVDVVAALPAGSNAIGKLAANSGVDIGDVDVTSISAGTNAIGKVGHDVTGMVSDLDADVGNTAEKIHTASDVAIKRIDIQAHPENTGYIFVGDSGVAGNGSGGGIRLAAGDFYSLDIDNTGDVYVAASVADEDVYYIYYT